MSEIEEYAALKRLYAEAVLREKTRAEGMTNEERDKLCDDLRRTNSSWLEDAAAEIERLADRVKSLDVVAALNRTEATRVADENDELRTQLDNLQHEMQHGSGRD